MKEFWTPEQEEYLRQNAETHTLDELAVTLGKKKKAVAYKLYTFGLTYKDKNSRLWSEEEYQFLRDHSATMTKEEMAAELGRSLYSVNRVCGVLGLKVKGMRSAPWKPEEEEYLRENWGTVSMATMMKTLGRTEASIRQRGYIVLGLGSAIQGGENITLQDFCEMSGITRERITDYLYKKHQFPLSRKLVMHRRIYYVDLEKALDWMEQHQELFDGAKVSDDLFVNMPDWLRKKKTADRKSKAHLSGYANRKSWTKTELSSIQHKLRSGYSYAQIAEEFGVQEAKIKRVVWRNGLSYSSKRFWSSEDFRFLQEHWETMSDSDLAKKLGHSKSSVRIQRDLFGMKRPTDHKQMSQEEKEFIRLNVEKLTQKEMAKQLGRNINTVHNYVKKLREAD